MKCPKCSNNFPSSESCPYCGIVISKYIEIQQRKSVPPPEFDSEIQNSINDESINSPEEESLGLSTQFKRYFAYLEETASIPWKPISKVTVLSFSIGWVFMVYLLATKDMMGSDSKLLYLTHNVNLVFHEAGHWIFGVFGISILTILGGSMNQLLIPLIVTASFWTRRDAVGFAFGLFWFFENCLDVAVYMADARALALPLIGGLGEEAHDWKNIFSHFGLLEKDTALASVVTAFGWFGILSTWAWLLWVWFKYKESLRFNTILR